MRGTASLVAVIVIGGALWWGLGYRASEAEVSSTALSTPLQSFEPVPAFQETTDQDRRNLLNERMKAMVREGRGARLQDEPAPRPSFERARPMRSSTALDLKTPPNIPNSALECLTQAIYYEARNESEAGQAAVAEVVMNRVRHRAYPNEVCAVVYQRNSRTCQFTFTCDGSIGRRAIRPQAWARAQRIAREVYEGRSASQLPANSVNYHANYVRPSWGQRLDRVRQIGAHIFYGSARGGGQTPGASRVASHEAAPQSGLVFVRNPALDQAYARHLEQAREPATSDSY